MTSWLSIEYIAFSVGDYPISYIELVGTIFGMLTVYYAAKPDILTWPTAVINEFAFLGLFFQVQLYADMLLQVYFFIATCYGWYFWHRQPAGEHRVHTLSTRSRVLYLVGLGLGTWVLGMFMSRIHLLLPQYFALPAAYPFADAFTTVASVMAMVLLSRKRIENWWLWMAVDVVAVVLYYLRDIRLVSLEYVVFLLICVFGYIRWRRIYVSQVAVHAVLDGI